MNGCFYSVLYFCVYPFNYRIKKHEYVCLLYNNIVCLSLFLSIINDIL